MSAYTPKTGAACSCKRGQERDNCPNCEGTGQVIDFRAIHAARTPRPQATPAHTPLTILPLNKVLAIKAASVTADVNDEPWDIGDLCNSHEALRAALQEAKQERDNIARLAVEQCDAADKRRDAAETALAEARAAITAARGGAR